MRLRISLLGYTYTYTGVLLPIRIYIYIYWGATAYSCMRRQNRLGLWRKGKSKEFQFEEWKDERINEVSSSNCENEVVSTLLTQDTEKEWSKPNLENLEFVQLGNFGNKLVNSTFILLTVHSLFTISQFITRHIIWTTISQYTIYNESIHH